MFAMDKYYTLMVVPEKQKGVKTYRIPTVLFKSLAFMTVMICLLIGVLAYDYWKILQQVYENKHLSIENRQLKEQIQLFQMDRWRILLVHSKITFSVVVKAYSKLNLYE